MSCPYCSGRSSVPTSQQRTTFSTTDVPDLHPTTRPLAYPYYHGKIYPNSPMCQPICDFRSTSKPSSTNVKKALCHIHKAEKILKH